MLSTILIFMLSFAATSVIANSNSINEADELAWVFYGNFNRVFDYGTPLNREFKIKGLDGYIQEINCFGYRDGNFQIRIRFFREKLSVFYKQHPSFKSDIKYAGEIVDYFENTYWAFPERYTYFLKVFYDHNLIPGFVLDRIFKETGLADFRLNAPTSLSLLKNASEF